MPPFVCACSIALIRRRRGAVTDVARHGAEALTHKTINYVRTPLTSSGTAWARRTGFAFAWEARRRRSRFRPGSTPGRTGLRFAWVAPDGIALCVGRAGRDSHLRGFLARGRMGFAFAWVPRPRRSRFRPGDAPGRTGFSLAWEAHPRNSRSHPTGPRNCKSHPIPADKSTQLAIPSGSAHATCYPVRVRRGRARRGGGRERPPSGKASTPWFRRGRHGAMGWAGRPERTCVHVSDCLTEVFLSIQPTGKP